MTEINSRRIQKLISLMYNRIDDINQVGFTTEHELIVKKELEDRIEKLKEIKNESVFRYKRGKGNNT